MPYEQITQLPDGANINLPQHAKEIHDEAVGCAEEQYGEESRAYCVAPAVERKYEKNEKGDWVSEGN